MAFAVVQAIDLGASRFGLATDLIRIAIVLALLGFPVAMVLAWLYELTPDGVLRTAEAEGGESAPQVAPWRIPSLWAALVAGAVFGVAATAAWRNIVEPAAPVIAVLPFETLTDAEDDRVLVSGLHDSVIGELGANPALVIIGRQAILSAMARTADPLLAGSELGADFLLEGSASRSGARLRLQLRLTALGDGRQVWRESYERQIDDVFVLQRELAGEIGRRLLADANVATTQPSVSPIEPRAVEAYLRGLELRQRFDLETVGLGNGLERRERARLALAAFEESVRLSPEFALGWAGLAAAHADLAADNVLAHQFPGNFLERSRAAFVALRRAESLDPNLFDTALVRAYLSRLEYDLPAAHAAAQRAYALRPSDDSAIRYLIRAHWDVGERARARELAASWTRREPNDPEAWTQLALRELASRRFDAAREAFDRAIALGRPPPIGLLDARARLDFAVSGDILGYRDFLSERADALGKETVLYGVLSAPIPWLALGQGAELMRLVGRDPTMAAELVTNEPCADIAATALAQAGNRPAAQAAAEVCLAQQMAQDPGLIPPFYRAQHYVVLAYYQAMLGRDAEARGNLERSEALLRGDDLSDESGHLLLFQGFVHASLGDLEGATRRIEEALAVRGTGVDLFSGPWLVWRYEHYFHNPGEPNRLKAYPPFRALMRRHGVDVDKPVDAYLR